MTFAFPMFLPRPAGSAPPATFEDAVIALLGAKLRAFWLYDEPSHLWQDTSGTTAVTSDTDPVGRVDDLSGNGKHLLQATGGNKPAYRTGPARVKWDGANDYLSVASAAFPIDEFELFQVAEQNSDAANGGISTFAPSSGNDYNSGASIALHFGDTNILLRVEASGINITNSGSGAVSLSLIELNKTASVAGLFQNTASLGTDTTFSALTSPHTGDYLEGARFLGGLNFYGNVTKYVTIMTAALTTDERDDLRDLINARYSLW